MGLSKKLTARALREPNGGWAMHNRLAGSPSRETHSYPTEPAIKKPLVGLFKLAEREGFEPSEPARAHLISNQAHSASSGTSPYTVSLQILPYSLAAWPKLRQLQVISNCSIIHMVTLYNKAFKLT